MDAEYFEMLKYSKIENDDGDELGRILRVEPCWDGGILGNS